VSHKVAKGLGISDATPYTWIKKSGKSIGEVKQAQSLEAANVKIKRLKAENQTLQEERDVSSKPSIVALNHLDRQFAVTKTDEAWVTDITYIRTYQGWLYLAVVIDLYSRMVVGWSMKPNLHRDIVLDALILSMSRRGNCWDNACAESSC